MRLSLQIICLSFPNYNEMSSTKQLVEHALSTKLIEIMRATIGLSSAIKFLILHIEKHMRKRNSLILKHC